MSWEVRKKSILRLILGQRMSDGKRLNRSEEGHEEVMDKSELR